MFRNQVQESEGWLLCDYTVEHLPSTKMRHAVALSSIVNVIGKEAILSKEVIHCEQETDELCSE